MSKKGGNFFEEHIEKIVLAAAGLVCVWLLVTRVLISPNAVSYDNQTLSPSEIDLYIRKQAEQLKDKLNQPPEIKTPYVSKLNGALDPNDPVREGVWGDLQGGFDGLFASAISGINTDLSMPLPPPISTEISGGKQYTLSVIGEGIGRVTDVAAEHIRAAAYVPIQPISEDVPYDKAAHEPNDIDLVTVEAKFDVVELYRKFRESFIGDDVREEWRDPCLAVPVFAAVQLQRQELLDDGNWSDWQTVPRSKIDHRRRMFEIIEDVGNLPPGGIKVRLLQFNEPDVRMDLLQPRAYQIASADQEWFPPLLHRKFMELQKKEKAEKRRDEIEAKKQDEQQPLLPQGQARPRAGGGTTRPGTGPYYQPYGGAEGLRGTDTSRTRPRRGRPDSRTGGVDMGLYGDTALYGDMGRAGGRQPARGGPGARGRDERNVEMDYLMGIEASGVPRKPSTNDIYYEFQDILITEMTDLSKWRQPLVFWAHDDMIEPGKNYRYRIRLGVFNPIAGAKQAVRGQGSGVRKPIPDPRSPNPELESQVILWSGFSDITSSVQIPERLYFFAKDIQEAAKMVTVQVSKYVLGYWYSENFAVRQGEAIGKVVELEPEASSVPRSLKNPALREPIRTPSVRPDLRRLEYPSTRLGPGLWPIDKPTEPQSIDYSTGAVLVDAVAVNDWSTAGQMRPRRYFDMFYSFDGTNIEHMPINLANWSANLLAAYNEINRLQREPKEPLRAWDSRVAGPRQRAPIMEGYEDIDLLYEEMMMEQMMGGEMRRR